MGTTIKEFAKYITLAYDWHGGGSSAFYRFASNKGTIYGVQHIDELCKEINTILEKALDMKEYDIVRLTSFLAALNKYKQELNNYGTILKGRDQYRTEGNRATS